MIAATFDFGPGVITVVGSLVALATLVLKGHHDNKTALGEIKVNVDGRLDGALAANVETTSKLIAAVDLINDFKNQVDALNVRLERVTGVVAPAQEVQSIVPEHLTEKASQPMTQAELDARGADHAKKNP